MGRTILRAILRLLLGLLFRVRVTGDSGQMLRGRPLVVANHDSLLDALLIAVFLPGAPLIVLPRALEKHWIGTWVRRVAACMELRPGDGDAVRQLVHAVRGGRPVVTFPQERVSTTGGIMKTYPAAAIVAARAHADVIPLRIQGSLFSHFAATSARWPRRWRPRIVITVLPAVRMPRRVVNVPGVRRQHLADALQRILQQAQADATPRRSVFAALLDAVEQYGRGTRIIEDATQQVQSYGELLKSSLALGRWAARFTEPGERVGVLLPNLSATVGLIFGLMSRGRVPAMLNYSGGVESLRGSCVAAAVRTIITARRFVEIARLEPLLAALSGYRIVYLEDVRADLSLPDKLWVLRALWWPRSALPAQDASATALVLFTSGSEAQPKGVAIAHDGLLAGIARLHAVIDFGPDDKYLNALPLYHIFGLISCTLMPLLTGTRLFLYTNPLHYKKIPEFAYTRDCTYIFGTGTFLGHYARQAHAYDFYRARVVIAGGEKLSDDVADLWLRKFGLRIHEGYGATECGPAMALNTPLAFRAGTVGRFLPGIEYCIVPVPGIGRGGVLHVRGPNLMQGYFFQDAPGVIQPPRSEIGAGWYNTGDVVSVDAEGFVTVHGRIRRFAKIAGEMVSLDRVESIACQASPGFQHAAMVEMTRNGESTVLLTTDPALDRAALLQAARQLGAQELAVARRVLQVDVLPLLGSGKVDYVALRQMVR